MQETNIVLDENNIQLPINIELPECEIFIDKSRLGATSEAGLKQNILVAGKKYNNIALFLKDCANHGFYLVRHDQQKGISVLRNMEDRGKFISSFGKRDIKLKNNVYYTLQKPVSNYAAEKLLCRMLVIFSSFGDYPYRASISQRTFNQDWPDVQKDIPENTWILRIADTGGVIGAFYMNTFFDPLFENNIQNLIGNIANECRVEHDDIVLYGIDKGATGALIHGMLGKYSTIAIEPIVKDKLSINMKNDSLFVDGIRQKNIDERIIELLNINKYENINIITSYASDKYASIRSCILNRNDINCYVFANEKIKSQKDILPHVSVFTKTMLNSFYYKLDKGKRTINY